MSTIKVDTIKNTSNVEVYTCKAWVNFDGTGTVAIRASENVASITDIATGKYEINFTNAFEDTNYACVVGVNLNTSSGGSGNFNRSAVANSATTIKAYFNTYADSSAALADVNVNQLAVFR